MIRKGQLTRTSAALVVESPDELLAELDKHIGE
jgi:hypothetical protein